MSEPSRILLVDDHPINLEILEELLMDDYQLATATSGGEALALAGEFSPDLVLLDVMMPGMDGYETCRRMRQTPALHHTRIVMVSAKALPEERQQGLAAGADAYITKPFDHKALLAQVQGLLQQDGARDEGW